MKKTFLTICFLLFSGCVNTIDQASLEDPLESINRYTHTFNKSIDKSLLRPSAKIYGNSVPTNLRVLLSNFSSNLAEPLQFANHILQGDLIDGSTSALRFGINSTVGLGGLLDVASYLKLFGEETTLDETLRAWQIPTGPYVELPFFGPSSVRGTIAKFVELTTDPIAASVNRSYKLAYYSTVGADLLNTRYEFNDTIDDILYKSFDSYGTNKSYYFQTLGPISSEALDNDLLEIYMQD